MSNAAHALDARVRAAAAAIADARAGRRGAPAIANVLDILPDDIFDRVVDDARAVLAALDALPPQPRRAGPVNAADASALRMEVGARTIAILTFDEAGWARAVIAAAGHEAAILEHGEGHALWTAIAGVLRTFPADPPPARGAETVTRPAAFLGLYAGAVPVARPAAAAGPIERVTALRIELPVTDGARVLEVFGPGPGTAEAGPNALVIPASVPARPRDEGAVMADAALSVLEDLLARGRLPLDVRRARRIEALARAIPFLPLRVEAP